MHEVSLLYHAHIAQPLAIRKNYHRQHLPLLRIISNLNISVTIVWLEQVFNRGETATAVTGYVHVFPLDFIKH